MPKPKSRTRPSEIEKTGTMENQECPANLDWKCLAAINLKPHLIWFGHRAYPWNRVQELLGTCFSEGWGLWTLKVDRRRRGEADFMRDVINLHEFDDFREPALLHEAQMVGMVAISLIGSRIRELHREAKAERVLGADLPQALESFHARDTGKLACSSEENHFGNGR